MGSTFFSCGMMLLMAMALTWLITVAWFFRRLRTRHSAAYESIGSPTLFWNNSPRLGWLTHRFLWSSRPRELGDSTIARLTIFMRVWIVAYVVLFFGLIALAAFTGLSPGRLPPTEKRASN